MSFRFHLELARIWNKAVSLYEKGHTNSKGFPLGEELVLLSSMGITIHDVFDHAEDWCLHGEPDFHSFLLVHHERRAYFWEEQCGIASTEILDPSALPAKNETLEGIVWLPRILPKARAKLKGELPPEIMYGCGGDRQFFRDNDLHAAEFLRLVRRFMNDDQAILQSVMQKRSSLTLP